MTEDFSSSTHPPLPPTTEEDRFSWLRLLRSRRVGPSTFVRLIREYGSVQNALAALPEVARNAGVEGYEICPAGVVEAELKAAKAVNARLLCLGSPDYPKLLSELQDAPPVLWAIGDIRLLQKPIIAVVGARNASSLGTRVARALSREIGSAGYAVVSGLARGIDAAAHMASLETGTIAVMAGGVDIIYPNENRELGEQIGRKGLRLSEQPMGMAPRARHFPARNRIISGVAEALLVVEAANKSGSLITAQNALDQGREILAVPGHPFDARASGCNMLIRDGAVLVRNGDDILSAINHRPRELQPELPMEIPAPPPERRSLRETATLHSKILDKLGPTPVSEDQLIRDLTSTASDVAPALIDLELDGKIERRAGGLLSKAV